LIMSSFSQDNTGSPNIRFYNQPPYKIAVLHGGPGAPGYMAPVARELSKKRGILEPLQTMNSVEEQIIELEEQLSKHAEMPAILIGSSWGAALALLTVAHLKIEIEKLIVIGSAVFDVENSARIEGIRRKRLNDEQRQRLEELELRYYDDRSRVAEVWGELSFYTDVYDPLTNDLEVIEVQYELSGRVWNEFTVLRDRPGYLKNEFSKIDIPTVVIHGDYDPHPIEGIRPFLEDCIKDIRFYILPKCGHYPWIERHARDRFYEILEAEIG
jgi:pimeloyl-ACP methyl ester carboxylesterase